MALPTDSVKEPPSGNLKDCDGKDEGPAFRLAFLFLFFKSICGMSLLSSGKSSVWICWILVLGDSVHAEN